MWECPQIFEVGDRFVMLSSAWDRDVLNYAAYAVGSYAGGRFTADSWGRLTYGPSFYAPSFFRDADGRAAISLWMRGVDDLDAGWAGAHSVPYLLGLDGDILVARPHPDLDKYRAPAADDGRIAGAAADVLWDGSGTLTVERGESDVLSVEGRDDGVIVDHLGERWELPRSDPRVRVILDAGAIELSTDRGLLGLGGTGADGISVSGSGVTAHALVRGVGA
jgi:beta-fructofuranosidase